jgi:hypothetical protein
MVRRPMPILEVLYEPRDGPRGAGGVDHLDRKIQRIFGRAKFELSLQAERQLLEYLFP